MFTCGDKYVASILYSLPTAPSTAHPASIPKIISTEKVPTPALSRKSRLHALNLLSRWMPENDFSMPITARSVNVEIPGRDCSESCMASVIASCCLLWCLVLKLVAAFRAMATFCQEFSFDPSGVSLRMCEVGALFRFRFFTLARFASEVENTTFVASSSFSTTSLTRPIRKTIRKAEPRFLLHCPESPNPQRNTSPCRTLATSLMRIITSPPRHLRAWSNPLIAAKAKSAYTDFPGTVGLKTSARAPSRDAKLVDMISAPATPQHFRSKSVIFATAVINCSVSYVPNPSS
mmetsp:Transcript_41051/g.63203  ORF Transcript_41051/g.63203 Transcript_41051/m.63203 type:complete len:291 (+) Transcript_41051:708-1580(+)